jgi:hypothetical protein
VAEIDGEGAARGRGSELRDTGSNERLLALGRKVARMGLAGLGKVVCRLGLVLGLAGWRLLPPFIFILKLFPFICFLFILKQFKIVFLDQKNKQKNMVLILG